MAIISKAPSKIPNLNVLEGDNTVKKSLVNINEIKKDIGDSKRSIADVEKSLSSRIKFRNSFFRELRLSKNKTKISKKRRERESELELRKPLQGAIPSVSKIISPGSGFFGGLLKALGIVLVGSLIKYVPTIIGYAKEFIARIGELKNILTSYYNSLLGAFESTSKLITSFLTNISKFDFFDSENRVKESFNDLQKEVENLGKTNDRLIDVFTKDLVKEIDGVDYGTYSGEKIPPVGGYPDSGDGTASGSGKGYSSSQTTPTGYSNVFELIASGEGGYESINRGNAGDSPGGAKRYLGKNLRDMTLTEIMGLQRKGEVFAVGKYQLIDKTMPGFVRYLEEKGYNPNTTKYSESIQEIFPEYVVNRKRPTVGKYLRGESGVTEEDAAQSLAREFASVGLSRPEAGRGVGQSRYAGVGDNRASISPQEVQQALRESREGMKKGSIQNTPSSNVTKAIPSTGKVPTLYAGDAAGSREGAHMGRDIATDSGTGLIAFTDGEITDLGTEKNYGNYVIWRDSSGIEHMYAHLLEIPPLSKGQKVSKGTIIGRVGSTGRSSGPHLHWEISPEMNKVGYKRRNPIDPLKYGFSISLPFGPKMSKDDIGKSIMGDTPSQQENLKIASTPFQKNEMEPTPISAISPAKDMKQVGMKIASDKKTNDIIIVQEPEQSGGSQGIGLLSIKSGDGYKSPSLGDVLNRFMKQKLMLELSYT